MVYVYIVTAVATAAVVAVKVLAVVLIKVLAEITSGTELV